MTDIQTHAENGLLLIGDRAEDTFIQLSPPVGGKDDDKWTNYPGWKIWQQPGGMDMLLSFLQKLDTNHHWDRSHSSSIVNSLSRVQYVDAKGQLSDIPLESKTSDNPVKTHNQEEPAETGKYRISHFDGYQNAPTLQDGSDDAPTENKYNSYRLIGINDAGQGIRKEPDVFEPALQKTNAHSVVVLKRHLPLISNEKDGLWRAFTSCHAKRILIVSADDLRAQGLRLSRGLSWEAVAQDIQIGLEQRDSALNYLASSVHHMIVLFDVEAAAVFSQSTETNFITAELVFDPSKAEGDVEESHAGSIYGKMNYFTACFLNKWADSTDPETVDIKAQVKNVMSKLQGYVELCMYENPDSLQTLTVDIEKNTKSTNYLSTNIDYDQRFPSTSLISKTSSAEIDEIAHRIVGEGVKALQDIPSATFRKFTTVDKSEIESFRAINRLIKNYLKDSEASKPLSIAVFGAPGSGKSFGVEQLVDKKKIPIKTFNLSEATIDDLPGFFHEIRTECLNGHTPLCFFDEFDTDSCKLISSFLAPMQDGKFREGARVHPTGRGIFVFAGGTATCFNEFYELAKTDQEDKGGKKMMDFVSRLSGFIDVQGPNTSNAIANSTDTDQYLPLRRAILLRAMIEKNMASIIHPETKHAAIEDGVIRAFLKIDRYKHGARSIEKLLTMCAQGQQKDRLTVSDLPHEAQLKLHVSADQFLQFAAQKA